MCIKPLRLGRYTQYWCQDNGGFNCFSTHNDALRRQGCEENNISTKLIVKKLKDRKPSCHKGHGSLLQSFWRIPLIRTHYWLPKHTDMTHFWGREIVLYIWELVIDKRKGLRRNRLCRPLLWTAVASTTRSMSIERHGNKSFSMKENDSH